MKVAGIIAEYNPFHNGHKFHMEQVKEITGADYLIVVMSGDFTQRGTPTILNKYARAQMALTCGADLVLEIPAYFASGSAEFFAEGAVSLLDQLGVVDAICFGSECGDIEKLTRIADILAFEPDEYQVALKYQLKSGFTYPVARNNALELTIPGFNEYSEILGSPNNILGIEYVKSILRRKSKIIPHTNIRVGSGYHDRKISGASFSSAISIRQSVALQDSMELIRDQVPEPVFDILMENHGKGFPVFSNDFSCQLKYKLFMEQNTGFEKFMDVTPELSDRICNTLFEMKDFDSFCERLKTKDITYARVSRCLNHILLDMKKEDMELFRSENSVYYARVLGLNQASSPLMKAIHEEGTIPLISKASTARNILSENGMIQFNKDVQVANVYESVVSKKFNCEMVSELSRPVCKI